MMIKDRSSIIGILGIIIIVISSGILLYHFIILINLQPQNHIQVNTLESKSPSTTVFPTNFSFSKQMPMFSNSMQIYQKTTKNRTEADIHDLAAKFESDGVLLTNSYPPGNINYLINQSSRFSANNKDLIIWDSADGDKYQNPKLLPSDKDVWGITDSFIHSHGLNFPGAVRGSISHSRGELCESGTDNCSLVNEKIVVSYHHIINGYDFLPDFIFVDLGENGNVLSFSSRWNSYTEVQNITIISPSEAIELLKTEGIQLDKPDIISGQTTIDTITIQYGYSDPINWTDIIIPLYYISGVIQGSNGNQKWDKYIPAVKTK